MMERLLTDLSGANADIDMRVEAAMISAAISGAALHPLAIDLDDETLRSHLMRLARRLFRLSE
ncbi:hypothetical protein [Nocardia vinacea]|uniref:hypothetical protein n=1 Tax=Nocardia vinacea TaxID=96468 RepID=UPI002E302D2F|nr:hypothetical protein [Nocardia vinacea]